MLMKGDSNACNTVLVAKYPTNVCPRYIVKMALFLQDSKSFKKPQGNPFISDLSDGIDLAQFEDYEVIDMEEKCQLAKDLLHQRKSNSQPDLNEKIHWHFQRIQSALYQVNEALERSKCDHAIVHDSLSRVNKAVKALGDDIQKPAIIRHKRNASIAYEALAFQ